MNKFTRKIVFLILVLIGIGGIGFGTNIYAKNNNTGNNLVLSQKFSGKKLDRINASIKTKNSYRFLIDSNQGLDNIKDFFIAGDKKAKVKRVANNTYIVKLPLNTTFLRDELTQIDNGTLPLNIGGYDVVQPEIVEGLNSGTTTDTPILNPFPLQEKGATLVGVLDTGIDYTHTDLSNHYDSLLSYDFINEDTDAMDDNGHGTQVSGLITDSELVGLKVLDVNGLGTTYDILEAIDYAKTNNIKVLNMSFGGMGDASTSAVCQAITDAKNNGIYTIVSAGNNNTSISNLIPASCSDAITIGATDSQNNKASFSNYGTGVMLYAPGVDINTTTLNNSYTTVSGTSFSAPFVTGLVAKELAFSGGLSYSGVVSNIINNYGLYYNFIFLGNVNTQNNSNQQQILTGTGWTNTDNLYDRFSDFEYIFNTEDYLYFKDKLNSKFLYKILNDKTKFGYGNYFLINNTNSIYSNKELYIPEYFNTGEYINYTQFINERNNFYELLGLNNNSLENKKFSTQSTGLGKYSINHQFSSISGIKLNNGQSYTAGISNSTNEIIYTSMDSEKLYKKSLNSYGNGDQLTTDLVNYGHDRVKISPQGDYVIYNNKSNGNTLYKKNLNSTGNGTIITTNDGYFLDISKDGTFIMYTNWGNYNLYKKSISDNLNGETITSTSGFYPLITPDQTSVIYVNGNDGHKLYKKTIGTTGNGIALTSAKTFSPQMSNNGDFVIYQNMSDGYKLYKKGTNEYGDGQAITNSFGDDFNISKDGSYIVYRNYLDDGKLYKKYIWESGDGTRLTDKSAIGIKISNNTNEVVYSNANDNYSLYKINLTDPKGFAMDDGLYKSPEILPGKNLGYLKINVDSIVPYGTDYNFYLANQKTEETLFEANEGGVDMMGSDIYLFGDNYINGTKQSILSKVNVGDTIYLDKNGNVGEFKVQYKDDWSIRLEYSSDLWMFRGAKIYIGGSNFVKLNKSDLTGTTNINLNNLFGLTTDKLYYKIELLGDTSDTTKTPVINSVELLDGFTPLSAPTNLHQLLQSSGLERKEIIPGEKIGNNQIGTGIILSATIDTNYTGKQFRFIFDIYANVNGELVQTTKYSHYIDNGTQEVTVPYMGAGDYHWSVRTVDTAGIYGDSISYGLPSSYILYNSFDPYPDGYKFKNNSPKSGLLGTIDKWMIFTNVFPGDIYTDKERQKAFNDLGLNKNNSFTGGNCFGMALSSLMYKTYPEKLQNFEPEFINKIVTGNIWNDLGIVTDSGKWNENNIVLKTILEYQLTQYYESYYNLQNTSIGTGALNILSELKNNPDKPYILRFSLRKTSTGSFEGHAVIPYKTEGNRIYIRDNNIPFSESDDKSHEQYIEVSSTGGINVPYYVKEQGYNFFKDLAIVNIDVFDSPDSSIGFSDVDMLLTLDGKSDIQIIDSEGRISGFSGGTTLEEIPGAHVIIPNNITLDGDISENTWKQIYLPQKQDVTIKVIAKGQETYNLMIAGGDYHTELNSVETSTGEIDLFNSKIDNLNINFDDKKLGEYNLTLDNFQESNTGSVSITGAIIVDTQEFDVDWKKVQTDLNDAVIQNIDTNNDGNYDEQIILPSTFQDLLPPTTTVSFSGTLTPNQTNSYIESTTISLESVDNEGGSGIEKTYYTIGNNTGTLEYTAYSGAIIVNGVNDYTLTYYSVDKFGNKESPKIVNFILTEKPETYQGELSGYVYEDINNNGIKETTEKTMAGWKICIDKNNNGNCEENNEPFILTNNEGYYEFNGLSTGTYKIIEIPHQNWNITYPTSGYYLIQLLNGQKLTNKYFGNIKTKIK